MRHDNIRAEPSNATRAALVSFFASTDGEYWSNKRNWLSSASVCAWHGVRCSGSDVIALELPSNNLRGTLPDALSALTKLRRLSLPFNHIEGTIPSLKTVINLEYVNFYTNKLSGSVPQFFDQQNLTYLDMGANDLSGAVPSFDNCKRLETIYLNLNRLSGTVPNFNLPKLQLLTMGGNRLFGTVPNFAALPLLQRLSLYDNQLKGTLPDFRALSALQFLLLDQNQLSGPLPSFETLKDLQILQLNSNFFTGTIPVFRSLTRLTQLLLDDNRLDSTFPNLEMPALQQLSLRSNNLRGQLTISKLPSLQSLDVSQNRLNGTVAICSRTLHTLVLASNSFQGDLSFIRNFPNLKFFDASANAWNTTLPTQLPAGLEKFLCAYCSITGTIPQSWAAMSTLSDIFLSSNNIDVPLPALGNVTRIDLSRNLLSGDLHDVLFSLWRNSANTTNWIPVSTEVLDLSSNYISGRFHPYAFCCQFKGKRTSLFCNVRVLSLADNLISGPLPSNCLTMSTTSLPLNTLDLSKTKVSGAIPATYARFLFLQVCVQE